MSPLRQVLAATYIVLSGTSLSCSRGLKESETRASGGSPGASVSNMMPSSGAPAVASEAPSTDPAPSSGAGPCSRKGWSSVAALGSDCRGVCEPNALTLVPKLEFKARQGWCEGCSFLQAPWATATPDAAVAGSVRAYGSGPDWLNIGLWLDDGKAGIVGIYDASLNPVAGFFVDTVQSQPCGRLASVKFSSDG